MIHCKNSSIWEYPLPKPRQDYFPPDVTEEHLFQSSHTMPQTAVHTTSTPVHEPVHNTANNIGELGPVIQA